MAKKNSTEHTVIRNQKLFCLHCGGEQAIPFPIAVDILAAMTKAFNKMHKSCPAVWKQPMPPDGMSTHARAEFWWQYGEHGTSSKTMWYMLHKNETMKGFDHPHDPDDFKRCHMLLEMVPEWRNEMHKMIKVSTVWGYLVTMWPELTDKFVKKQYQQLYEEMKKLGC